MSSSQMHLQHGWMYKQGDFMHSWKCRFFVLRHIELRYFESDDVNNSGRGNGQPLGFIDLNTIMRLECLEPCEDEPEFHFGFQISCRNRCWQLYCKSDEDRSSWMQLITERIGVKPAFLVRVQGQLEKQGSLLQNWKHRWHVVGQDSLMYFENTDKAKQFALLIGPRLADIPNHLLETPLGVIPLKNAAVKLLPEWQGKRHALIVNSKDREFVMIADDADIANCFLYHINAAIEAASQCLAADQTLAQSPSLVSRSPDVSPESQVANQVAELKLS